MIVDANIVLGPFFPNEEQSQAQALIRCHESGLTRLAGPTLILYEVTNAVVQAVRRGCVTNQDGEAILAAFEGLGIEMKPVDWQQMLPLAPRFDRSAYYAAYLALAKEQG